MSDYADADNDSGRMGETFGSGFRMSMLGNSIDTVRGDVLSHNTITVAPREDSKSTTIELAHWISSCDFEDRQHTVYQSYARGTCRWLLDEAEFWELMDREHGALWCHGKAGSGKTTLSSFLIQHLRTLPSTEYELNPTVSFVYCRYTREFTTLQLLEALLRQVLLQAPSSLSSHHKVTLSTWKSRNRRPCGEELLSILQDCFDKIRGSFVVIDALDECFSEAVRTELVHHLLRLATELKIIRLVMTSRPLPSIEALVGHIPSIEIVAKDDDLRLYIQKCVTGTGSVKRLLANNETLQADVESAVIEHADGMFLVARLHVERLTCMRREVDLRKEMNSLPSDVRRSYEDTLTRINAQSDEDKKIAYRALSWVYHAVVPLQLCQLQQAIAIQDGDEDLYDETDILSSCCGLIQVDEYPGWPPYVHFLHYTTKEFFAEVIKSRPEFPSEVDITLLCIRSLRSPTIAHEPHHTASQSASPWSDYETRTYPGRRNRRLLYEYAIKAWVPLVKQNEMHPSIADGVINLLADRHAAVRISLELFGYGILKELKGPPYSGTIYRGPLGALHLLSLHGISAIIPRVLLSNTGVDINEINIYGHTPLMLACIKGYVDVVQVLLGEADIKTNIRGPEGMTAIICAAKHHHEDIIHILLAQEGSHDDCRYHNGRTLLSYAAEYGMLTVVQALLDQSFVVKDSEDNNRRTPFSYASAHGHKAVVRAFLKRSDINKNSRDIMGKSPLDYATQRGHATVVRDLLKQNDVERNSRDYLGRTPIFYASVSPFANQSSPDVIRAFLEQDDVEKNHRDDCGRTPLSHFAEKGPPALIQAFLIRNDIEKNSKDDSGRTPFSYAAVRNKLDVVQAFLELPDIEKDSGDDDGRTPLSYAAERGSPSVVRALLEQDEIDKNSRDGRGRTPFSYAIKKGKHWVARDQDIICHFLARDDVEKDCRDDYGRTPLSYAAECDTVDLDTICAFLEQNDVDKNSRDRDGRTPLSYAAQKNRPEIVAAFLQMECIMADSRDKSGSSPLSYAAGRVSVESPRDSEKIVRSFLERPDVEIDSRDNDGWSPFLHAAAVGNLPVVQAFLELRGIERDPRDKTGRSPLSWVAAKAAYEFTKDAIDVIHELLKMNDIDPDSRDDDGRTPLSYAAEECIVEVVQMLLETENIEINSRDNKGRSPLSYAASRWRSYNDSEETVRAFLERADVEIDSRDNDGRSPFSYAAGSGNLPVVQAFLELRGVETDSRDKSGRSPLSWAAGFPCSEYSYHNDVIHALLKMNDIDPDSRDNDGRTPLSYAAEECNLGVIQMLVETENVEINSRDNKGRSSLSYAASRPQWHENSEAVIRAFLERPNIVNDSRDNDGRSPFSYAAECGTPPVVQAFLEHDGIETDSRDKSGRSPLSWAAGSGRDEIIHALLKINDINPDSRDNDGRTPLSYAAEKCDLEVIQMLLETGNVKIDSTDNSGMTPLDWARKWTPPDWFGRVEVEWGISRQTAVVEFLESLVYESGVEGKRPRTGEIPAEEPGTSTQLIDSDRNAGAKPAEIWLPFPAIGVIRYAMAFVRLLCVVLE